MFQPFKVQKLFSPLNNRGTFHHLNINTCIGIPIHVINLIALFDKQRTANKCYCRHLLAFISLPGTSEFPQWLGAAALGLAQPSPAAGEGIAHWHLQLPFIKSRHCWLFRLARRLELLNEVEGNQKHGCLIRLDRQCVGSHSLVTWRTVSAAFNLSFLPAIGQGGYVTPNFLP